MKNEITISCFFSLWMLSFTQLIIKGDDRVVAGNNVVKIKNGSKNNQYKINQIINCIKLKKNSLIYLSAVFFVINSNYCFINY